MRILHLTTFLQGGAGLAITSLAAAQSRAGHDVTVLTSRTGAPGYGNYAPYFDVLDGAGVTTWAVDSLFDRRAEAHVPVRRCLDDQLGGAGSFDLLHAHAAVPAALARAAIERACRRVPLVQTMHGWGLAKSPAQAAHDVSAMNHVDRLVVPARTSAALLASLGVDRHHMAVVPYGVAPTAAYPPIVDLHLRRIREWRRRGDFVVCAVGTIGERKNQALLVDALALLPGNLSVRALIVGDGPGQALRDRAEAKGVASRVHLLGYQPGARRYAAESNLLVLPSRSEGQPLAVLEAFCDGVPVAASRIPELTELVEDGRTGWLFDCDDAPALARTLEHVCRMPGQARAMVARARGTYAERFTIERMVNGYMHEYARAS